MMPNDPTARELEFRFPAEWEPQEAVWFAWPTRDDLWLGRLNQVLDQLASLYVLASRFQRVRVLCPEMAQADLTARMSKAGESSQVELWDYQCDDVWIRDFGPLFLLSSDASDVMISDWRYNAWGNKFPLLKKDDGASKWIADRLGVSYERIDYVLEGGAIESDGAGRIMTTEAVLLNPNRNGETTREEVEVELRKGLGVDAVLWLKDGLKGDDTDGHIDNLARFLPDGRILIADAEDSRNLNSEVLLSNQERAMGYISERGEPFELVRMPMPDTLYDQGEPLAASYMNYLILNGAILAPTYQQPQKDEQALEILRECFSGREVVGFDCSDIIYEGGAVHCMSQHQPSRE